MTGGIMIAAAAYLWKRWRQKEGVKTAVTLSALVALYPILAGGSMEKIWLGYLTTLLLSAPIPALMFVNYAHQMPAGQRHEPYYIPKGEQVCPLLQPHGIFKGEQVCPLLQPHGIFKGEQVCLLLQPHGIFKGEQVCLLLQPHGIFKGEQVCLLLQPHRCVFSRASRCVFYYSRFAAGGFLAASLVMEPSCSGLMAASPPGPADAQIGLIGTASQQPA